MEMRNVAEHHEHEVEHVQTLIHEYSSEHENAFNRGAIALLQEHLNNLQIHLKESKCASHSLEGSCSDLEKEILSDATPFIYT